MEKLSTPILFYAVICCSKKWIKNFCNLLICISKLNQFFNIKNNRFKYYSQKFSLYRWAFAYADQHIAKVFIHWYTKQMSESKSSCFDRACYYCTNYIWLCFVGYLRAILGICFGKTQWIFEKCTCMESVTELVGK